MKAKQTEISHIFIIPYRNRYNELKTWISTMTDYLDIQLGIEKYEILIIHQTDGKMFNRGGLCNIGFMEAKKRYPETYHNIQFIIHDVDIYPVKQDIIKYYTIKGEARHPYGVLRPNLGGTLGGICIIYGSDYEKVNGMPNYFGWGGEDVALSRRCQANKIRINEDNFINRRSTPDIIDPESHTNKATVRINMITDKLHLRKAFNENSLLPQDGITTCNYQVVNNFNNETEFIKEVLNENKKLKIEILNIMF